MLLLGLDFESTGLDIKTARITEVGAVVWNVENKKPEIIINDLLYDFEVVVTPEIEKLTGIFDALLKTWGKRPPEVLENLLSHMALCDYVVAHNGTEFDRPLLQAELARHGLSADIPNGKPWIDTRMDVEYPEDMKTSKLKYLACEHGFINPFSHRAVFDVLTMLSILSRYNIEDVIALSEQPLVKLQALCNPPWEDGGRTTDIAKSLGFHWKGDTKQWLLNAKEKRANQLLSTENLKIIKLE